MDDFIDACNDFEALDAEPNTEDIYSPNVPAIKGQKGVYARTLRRIAEGMRLESDASTIYDRCRRMFAEAEGANMEILKTNSRFQIVLRCYRRHLRDFKSSSSSLEMGISAMKRELEGREQELGEYRNTLSVVQKLNMDREELEVLKGRREGVVAPLANLQGWGYEEGEAQTRLKERKAEEERLGRQSSELRAGITSLLMPLERAARKFDYMSASKRHLLSFISEPQARLKSEADHAEFREMLKELKEGLGSGRINVKNGEAVSRAATLALETDIYSMVKSLSVAGEAMADIETEIRNLEIEIGYIKSHRADAETAARNDETMRNDISRLEGSINATKAEIERMLMGRYGKRIEVVL